jgi:hypothetical protein
MICERLVAVSTSTVAIAVTIDIFIKVFVRVEVLQASWPFIRRSQPALDFI